MSEQFFFNENYHVSVRESIFTNEKGMMAYVRRQNPHHGGRESNGKLYSLVAIYSYLRKEYIREYEQIPEDIHQYVLNAFSQEAV